MTEYFVTILQRAKRTDIDLKQEVTYYDRECNLVDISAGIQDSHALILDKALFRRHSRRSKYMWEKKSHFRMEILGAPSRQRLLISMRMDDLVLPCTERWPPPTPISIIRLIPHGC